MTSQVPPNHSPPSHSPPSAMEDRFTRGEAFGPMVDASDPRISSESCLGRTCMKWQADGELTSFDYQLILQRLSRADALMGINS